MSNTSVSSPTTTDVSATGAAENSILMFLCLVGVVENILVCWLICSYRRLRTATNIFIFSLCTTNGLCTGILLPTHSFAEHSEVYPYLNLYIILTYISNLTAVTCERFISITRPLRYHQLVTKKRAIRITVICYVIPLLYCSLPLTWQANKTTTIHKVYVICTLLIFLIAPLIFILGVYARVYRESHIFFKKHQKLLALENKEESALCQEARFMCCLHRSDIEEEEVEYFEAQPNTSFKENMVKPLLSQRSVSLDTELHSHRLFNTILNSNMEDDIAINGYHDNVISSLQKVDENIVKNEYVKHGSDDSAAKISTNDSPVKPILSKVILENNCIGKIIEKTYAQTRETFIENLPQTPIKRNSILSMGAFLHSPAQSGTRKISSSILRKFPLPSGMSPGEAASLSKEFTFPRDKHRQRSTSLASSTYGRRKRSETMLSSISKIIGKRKDSTVRSSTRSINSVNRAKQMLSEIKASFAFAMVALTYMFTWLPVAYMTFAIVIEKEHELIPEFLALASIYTIGLNAMIDPLLYGLFLKDFRRTIKRIIMRRRTLNL